MMKLKILSFAFALFGCTFNVENTGQQKQMTMGDKDPIVSNQSDQMQWWKLPIAEVDCKNSLRDFNSPSPVTFALVNADGSFTCGEGFGTLDLSYAIEVISFKHIIYLETTQGRMYMGFNERLKNLEEFGVTSLTVEPFNPFEQYVDLK